MNIGVGFESTFTHIDRGGILNESGFHIEINDKIILAQASYYYN